MSIYKVRHEWGDIIHEGTESECDLILNSMNKLGMKHNCEIIYPESYDFKLSEGVKDKMRKSLIDHYAEGKDYSDYRYDISEGEVDELTDAQLIGEYEETFAPEDTIIDLGNYELNSYKAEKELLSE